MSTNNFHFDTELYRALNDLQINDYTIIDDEVLIKNNDGEITHSHVNLTFTITPNTQSFSEYLRKRFTYYDEILDNPSVETSLDRILTELNTGLDVEFNRVGSSVPNGEYTPIGNGQWESVTDTDRYPNYRELLRDVTNDKNPMALSVPELYDDTITAIADSPDHELPNSPVVIEQLLQTHIKDVKAEEQSRNAQHELKRRLENRGVNPRSAASIASDMDDLLIPDADLA